MIIRKDELVLKRLQEEDIEKKLRLTIKSALKAAEDKGVESIAFPPMGTGFYGIPLNSSADIMLNEFSDHLSHDTSIKELVICVNDNRELKIFQDMWTNN